MKLCNTISVFILGISAFRTCASFLLVQTDRKATANSFALQAVKVALTREQGKNDKLRKALAESLNEQIEVVEVPCIAHADGPDFDRLADTLSKEGPWDYVAVTSPEAAHVLASAWDAVRDNPPPVTAVGKATETALHNAGIQTSFCPSRALAKTLVEELPAGESRRLLYPASLRAKTTLEEGLGKRGFEVVRLNTYDTVTAEWTDVEKQEAASARIACFASPSSIKGWLKNTDNNISVLAACIGETSAEACRQHGWPDDCIFYPEAPGIEGWVTAVKDALQNLQVAKGSV